MIQRHSDYLVFEVSGGDKIPCSVEKLTIEILADSLDQIDPEVIRQAAKAVLHYFREEVGRESVTVDEFTSALEQVLIGLGFQVRDTGETTPCSRDREIGESDLNALATALGEGLELDFYTRLRRELQGLLAGGHRVIRFHGLRPCAKRLAHVRRWCPRSLRVSDEIVRFLRACWGAERPEAHCALMVN